MSEAPTTGPDAEGIEQALRDGLARADAAVAAAGPALRQLVVHEGHALFSDAVVAGVRGMILDLAGQLLLAQAEAGDIADCTAFVVERQDGLAEVLLEDRDLLAHAHAAALEARLSERLRSRGVVDEARTPLIGQFMEDRNPDLAELAKALLASQTQFVRHQRRMEWPLVELPAPLFAAALAALAAHDLAVERSLRGRYDADATRLRLLETLVKATPDTKSGMLSLEGAGLAIFASALAAASGQTRERVILSFADPQATRSALALRAAGLTPEAAGQQLRLLQPDIKLPAGFEQVPADRAASLLATAQAAVA